MVDIVGFVCKCKLKLDLFKPLVGQDQYLEFSSTIVSLALGELIFIVNQAQKEFESKLSRTNDNLVAMKRLEYIIRSAADLLKELEGFSMNFELRQHLIKNNEVLNSVHESTVRSINNLSNRKEETTSIFEYFMGWGVIIFVAFVVLKACS